MLICFRQTIINRILSPLPPSLVTIESHYQDKLQVFDIVAAYRTNDISSLIRGEAVKLGGVRYTPPPLTVSHYACKREYSIKMRGKIERGRNFVDCNTRCRSRFGRVYNNLWSRPRTRLLSKIRKHFAVSTFSSWDWVSLNETCRKYLMHRLAVSNDEY